MKYLLLMYANEDASKSPAAASAADPQNWYSLLGELKTAGVLVDTNGLGPVASATTVRVRDGKTLTTDGPFAETHEQLGGYFILDCQDLDEAIRWAAKIPTSAYGSIEIRPLYQQ